MVKNKRAQNINHRATLMARKMSLEDNEALRFIMNAAPNSSCLKLQQQQPNIFRLPDLSRSAHKQIELLGCSERRAEGILQAIEQYNFAPLETKRLPASQKRQAPRLVENLLGFLFHGAIRNSIGIHLFVWMQLRPIALSSTLNPCFSNSGTTSAKAAVRVRYSIPCSRA